MPKIYYVLVKFDDTQNPNAERDAIRFHDSLETMPLVKSELHVAQKGMHLSIKAI